MLFNIPDEKFCKSVSPEGLCIDPCDIPKCDNCIANLKQYKVEGKNPIFQKVYDKYISKERIDLGTVFLSEEAQQLIIDMWGAIKTYMEDGND